MGSGAPQPGTPSGPICLWMEARRNGRRRRERLPPLPFTRVPTHYTHGQQNGYRENHLSTEFDGGSFPRWTESLPQFVDCWAVRIELYPSNLGSFPQAGEGATDRPGSELVRKKRFFARFPSVAVNGKLHLGAPSWPLERGLGRPAVPVPIPPTHFALSIPQPGFAPSSRRDEALFCYFRTRPAGQSGRIGRRLGRPPSCSGRTRA